MASTRSPAPVQVLNAVGRKGLAGRYSGFLKTRGWAPLTPHDASSKQRATVIYYAAGRKTEALALAKRLPFRVALAPSRRRSQGLVLILGTDSLTFDNRLRQRVTRA